jgi:thiosulfate reductase cytochrome b subunit
MLRKLITEIADRIAIYLITGHNQYAAKACPGFHVPSWLTDAERT